MKRLPQVMALKDKFETFPQCLHLNWTTQLQTTNYKKINNRKSQGIDDLADIFFFCFLNQSSRERGV
jgi:hypothetical protein